MWTYNQVETDCIVVMIYDHRDITFIKILFSCFFRYAIYDLFLFNINPIGVKYLHLYNWIFTYFFIMMIFVI